jgi:hypothetical protein
MAYISLMKRVKGIFQGNLKNNSGILEEWLMDILRVSIKYPSSIHKVSIKYPSNGNYRGDIKEYSIGKQVVIRIKNN